MHRLQRQRAALFLALCLCLPAPSAGWAQTALCAGGGVTVNAQTQSLRDQVCRAAATAQEVVNHCDIPLPEAHVTITVTDDLVPGCVGLFHSDDNLIEVLPPAIMDERLGNDSVFAGLDEEGFFASIVAHEFAHAVANGFPCSSGNCVTAGEYVAYALQILAMEAGDRAAFEQRAGLVEPVAPEQLSGVILMFAPDLFAARVWSHFSAQPDGCSYLRDVLEGRVSFDREEP
ncbi:DUF6639 family protein [Oceanibium sediminis]|uniref:DUF6639 family protein n=1 Tax=Oceanibium sediminis TaxID=2026339 RepID=UPI00280BB2A6|nr:DUF6639 family protein [Oceanibium sediminis]